MSTTRTVRAEQPGPVTIRTDLPAQDLSVVAEDRETAELTIATTDDEGTSADAVRAATLTARGNTLECRLPRDAGSTTIVSGRGGSISVGRNFGVVAGNVTGMIMTGGGDIVINGQRISGGAIIVGGSPIVVTARVPAGSSVRASSISGDVECSGRYAEVSATSTSGDIEIDEAAAVRASTTSGDIAVERLTGRADLNSVSGDISVAGPASAQVFARTVSGNVRGSGGVDLDASTVSGRVRNR